MIPGKPPIELVGLIGLTAAAIATALFTLLDPRHRAVRARLLAITTPNEAQPISLIAEDARKRSWERLLIALGKKQAAASMAGRRNTLRSTLRHAGFRRSSHVAIILGLRLLLAAGLPLLALPLMITSDAENLGTVILLSGSLAGIGFLLPRCVVGILARRRTARVDLALPDVLDLLVLCVEAGLAVPAAIARVADDRADMRDPLGDELSLLANELRVGVPRRDALRNFADRSASVDLRTLVAHLIQTDRLGGDLGPALRAQADMVRVTRRLKVEEVTQRMPVRMLLPTAMFMPALFIVIFVPVALHAVQILSGG